MLPPLARRIFSLDEVQLQQLGADNGDAGLLGVIFLDFQLQTLDGTTLKSQQTFYYICRVNSGYESIYHSSSVHLSGACSPMDLGWIFRYFESEFR